MTTIRGLSIAVLALAATSLIGDAAPRAALAGGPTHQMAVDVDANTPGVQATRTVDGTGPFTVAIHVTIAETAYTSYEWGLSGPLAGATAETHNTAGTGLSSCFGNTCFGPATTFVGWVSEFDLACPANGTLSIAFDDAVTVLGAGEGGQAHPTDIVDAVVECTGVPEFPVMSIRHSDGNTGPFGGGSVLNVAVGTSFDVEFWVDQVEAPHQGYQWEIAYDPAYLVHTGSNQSFNSALSLCANPSTVTFSGFVIYGQGAGCLSPTGPVIMNGKIQTAELECVAPTPVTPTSTPVLLVAYYGDAFVDSIFGTTLIDNGAYPFTTTLHKGPNPIGSGTIAQITVRCVEPALDPDNDGCSNAEETGANQLTGGKRDPFDGNDFFDVPAPALSAGMPNGVRNKAISLVDVGAVLYFVGTVDGGMPNPNGYDYDSDFNANTVDDGAEYDRTPSMLLMQPWRSGAPNGAVSLQDVGVALAQVGTNCTAPP